MSDHQTPALTSSSPANIASPAGGALPGSGLGFATTLGERGGPLSRPGAAENPLRAASEADGRKPDGQGSSSLDNESISARKLRPSKEAKRRRRCFHRVMSGLERGGMIRFLTLTSSPQSPQNVHRSFRILIKRMERRGLIKGYIQVPELTDSGLEHKHILFRGSFVEQALLSTWWKEIHKAGVVDIRKVIPFVKGKKAIANYMAKYMVKASFKRYSWSWGWVWKGFVKDWKWLYRWWYYSPQHNRFGALLFAWKLWLKNGQTFFDSSIPPPP